ncbi:SseB family protein [Streptomyces sp. HNM0574]|uniref:SseB family protein n=1 Tax=Streptomyces sp. HNM0574 TaxID=2714954 RepID=UPI00146D4226|nr:SseB family protein [Streptomyces sp. HNM0574]NLU66686.1 SseB family protein [Streptomyces sp. HNM0574]
MPVGELAEGLAALSGGDESVDLRALVGEFRRSVVLVPTLDDSLLTVESEGLRWLFAFTGEEPLADFARARGLGDDSRAAYLTMRGARLLDVVVPAVPGPAGVAVDAGSGAGMLLPPVRGVVPDEAAVDASAVQGEGNG